MLLVNAMSRQPLQVHGRSMASAFRQNQGDVMFLVALLLLVVRPGAPSSFLFLVAMPFAPFVANIVTHLTNLFRSVYA